MNKIIVVIVFSFLCFVPLRSQNQTSPKKIFAEIQAGPILIYNNSMSGILSEASATLGYNINSRFAAGIGLSTIHFVTATPYIYGKVNFSKIENRSIIPFLSLNAGYTINAEKGESQNNRITLQPKLGLSFYGKKKKSSFIVYAGALIYHNKVLPSIGIGIGF
ncbi:MAG: hypothetical protein PHI32_15030 [Dysgonamonadaceae bacterium]|nr:hypothetical protein [Dysgonamonadaceae bacterium]